MKVSFIDDHRDEQHLSIRFTERLTDAGIEPSGGSKGDFYDAMAESVIGLYTTGLIRRRGHGRAWRT